MDNFQFVSGGFDVAPLREALEENFDLWSEITIRQEYPGTAHGDTEAIFFRGPKAFTYEEYMCTFDAHDYPAAEDLADVILPLMNPILTELNVVELGYMMAVKLKAGGVVEEHIDEGLYAEHYTRLHLVLSSSEGNVFSCGDEQVEMKEGELWWFNHRHPHSVVNNSGEDRIHLIFDVVPEKED